MKFSPLFYSRLKDRLVRKYQKEVRSLSKDARDFPKLKASRWFQKNIDHFADFTPVNWFLLSQLDSLFYFSEATEHVDDGPEFSQLHEEIFDGWNKSEFSGRFLRSLNTGLSLKKASGQTLKAFDNHLVTLGERHVLRHKKQSWDYVPQTSLGEVKDRRTGTARLMDTTITVVGKHLVVKSASLKEMKDFANRIEAALKIIKTCSPTSWERFRAFTEAIVPIKQSEFVSYSHQDLPAYSMINLYDRDFVDLMDDLLHENGHHHLNYYLNLTKLIDEPEDAIYYSPWRRTPRPLRGIYHAYFTFFWAFKLFADLIASGRLEELDRPLSGVEREKVYWRAVEEFHMLNFSFGDLRWARKKGLITKVGWELVEEQQRELRKFQRKIPLWEKKLVAHRKDLRDLRAVLKSAAKHYSKKNL